MAHPIAAAAALSLLWQPPSNGTAALFSAHNFAAASAIVDSEVSAFNACLDSARSNSGRCLEYDGRTGVCRRQEYAWNPYHRVYYQNVNAPMTPGYCHPDDLRNLRENTGKKAPLWRYLACSPFECVRELSVHTFSVGHSTQGLTKQTIAYADLSHFLPTTILLNTTSHILFNGTSLAVLPHASGTGFTEWNLSQAAANIAVACEIFKSYDNTSVYMHDHGYSMTDHHQVVAPPLISNRYPRAAELVAAAASLEKDGDFCGVF